MLQFRIFAPSVLECNNTKTAKILVQVLEWGCSLFNIKDCFLGDDSSSPEADSGGLEAVSIKWEIDILNLGPLQGGHVSSDLRSPLKGRGNDSS